MRAASALLADHRVDRVGLLGRRPPGAWGDRAIAIDSAVGWDVSVGADPASLRSVTIGSGGDVSWAGPTGLARSLGAILGSDPDLAATVVGSELDTEPRFGFPSPLGWLGGRENEGIYHCPTRSPLAAVIAIGGTRTMAVLDHREFLDGALLAAGVLLATEGHNGPVWHAPDRFLALCDDVGLVLADSVS